MNAYPLPGVDDLPRFRTMRLREMRLDTDDAKAEHPDHAAEIEAAYARVESITCLRWWQDGHWQRSRALLQTASNELRGGDPQTHSCWDCAPRERNAAGQLTGRSAEVAPLAEPPPARSRSLPWCMEDLAARRFGVQIDRLRELAIEVGADFHMCDKLLLRDEELDAIAAKLGRRPFRDTEHPKAAPPRESTPRLAKEPAVAEPGSALAEMRKAASERAKRDEGKSLRERFNGIGED